jgi:CheY-specific phosphatase CheX
MNDTEKQMKTTTETIKAEQLGQFMSRHFVDVFSTMLALEAVLSTKSVPQHGTVERVTGSVGFAGENVTGAIYVHFSETLAKRATAAMLGIPAESISGHADVNDVIGEVANMLTGGLKSWLCDAGAPCAMSTPAIIRGTSFEIEVAPDVDQQNVVFECGGELVVVEIHVKLN